MDEQDKRPEEDVEGHRRIISPEGTEEEAEGQVMRRVSPEGTEEDAEGHGHGKRISSQGTEEDDTEGHTHGKR
jgi:hypothetical protein